MTAQSRLIPLQAPTHRIFGAIRSHTGLVLAHITPHFRKFVVDGPKGKEASAEPCARIHLGGKPTFAAGAKIVCSKNKADIQSALD